jgi:uncharacterized membrane protein YdfJ with MMPL/SSD domain
MFATWGRAMVRWRGLVLVAAAGLVIVGATWGAGVFEALSSGGFEDPNSESARAYEQITEEFGQQSADLLVLYESQEPVASPPVQEAITDTLEQLRQQPEVASVVSWYDTGSPALVSTDGLATYAIVQLVGEDEDSKLESLRQVESLLSVPGVDTTVGGLVMFLAESAEITESDIIRAELLSAPVLLVLLVLIFRGVVAAAMPLLVAMLAILGGFLTTRLLTLVSEVSVFAANVITLVGVGMAIDYALFIVSRFREELATPGMDPATAVSRTLATAGRTVFVSGLTIALALASLLIFPQPFLRSIALGGMSAVLVAMLASLTVLPALLMMLGPRINAGRIPLPWRRRARRASTGHIGEGGWARLARSVMRRPVLYAVGVTVVLVLLALPALRMNLGGYDVRVLPEQAQTRVVADAIDARFPDGTTEPIDVLVTGAAPAEAEAYLARVEALPEVTGVTLAGQQDGSWLLRADYLGEPTGDAAEEAVAAIRALPSPAEAEVLVGGTTASYVDLLDSLGQRLPWMLLLIVTTILVLLFLAFGSVVLPIKAVLMNVISIGASFGVVVWVFQDGHFADLLQFTPTGFVEPTMPIMMLAILFGLSTDYEVFLLSRVREEWDRIGNNTEAVARGLQHTGRIITAAALLLGVVVAGFTAGDMAVIKLAGVGMIVALAVDATLVRALLVPATMRLLGRWNWWAPGPLGRLYRRYSLH